MGTNEEIGTPLIRVFSNVVGSDEKINVYLHVVEFANGIFVSIYDDDPRLGSISLSYPVGDNVDRYTVFSGKQTQYVDALTMLVAKKRKKLVLGSVNISNEAHVTFDTLKQLIGQYTSQLGDENE